MLSRHRDESIVIDLSEITPEQLLELQRRGEAEIVIVVVEIRGDKARLGCSLAREIPCHRQEVYDAIKRENHRAEASRLPHIDMNIDDNRARIAS